MKTYQSSLLTCLLSIACVAATATVNADTAPPASPAPVPVVAPTLIPDPSALKLLNSAESKLLSLNSLQANDTTANFFPFSSTSPTSHEIHASHDVYLKKPNFYRQEDSSLEKDKSGSWTKAASTAIIDTDGKKNWLWVSYNNEYRVRDADAQGKTNDVEVQPLRGFFDTSRSLSSDVQQSLKDGSFISLNRLKPTKWNGKFYQVVEFVSSPVFFAHDTAISSKAPGGKVVVTEDFYIGKDSLIGRVLTQYNLGWKIDD